MDREGLGAHSPPSSIHQEGRQGDQQPQAEFVSHFALGSSGGKIEALPLVRLRQRG